MSGTTKLEHKSVPPKANEGVFPTDNLRSYVCLASRCKTPSTRTESLIQYSSILDFGEINESIYDIPVNLFPNTGDDYNYVPGFISTSSGSIGANKTSAISFEKGCCDNPE